MNWNELTPTAEAWAQALAVLIERAESLNADDPTGRNTLIDELTEFIVCSPPVAAQLDKMAADAVDELLAAEVSARLSHLGARARALATHSAGVGTATRPVEPASPGAAADGDDPILEERGSKRS